MATSVARSPSRSDDLVDEREIGELVARALQEEHRTGDLRQVIGARGRRRLGRMQGKADEEQAAHAGERRRGLRLRAHAAAERLAAGKERHAGQAFARARRRSAHARLRDAGGSTRFEPRSMNGN